MRTLTITAAEWASAKDGTLWLVGEGSDCTEGDHCYTAHDDNAQHPPAEFAQACAFCTACDARLWDRGHNRKTDCLDCRIELVGPCPHPTDKLTARMEGNYGDGSQKCRACGKWRSDSVGWQDGGTVTLGHAYAVGQPLPIVHQRRFMGPNGPSDFLMVWDSGRVQRWTASDDEWLRTGITDRLAHYGPPESLVGKWALQLAVTA